MTFKFLSTYTFGYKIIEGQLIVFYFIIYQHENNIGAYN